MFSLYIEISILLTFLGSALGINQAPIKAVKFQCKGTESSLNKCKMTVSSTCLSNNYVALYCSRTLIIEKGKNFVFIDLVFSFHNKAVNPY
jgi:hypothetical protein